MSEKRYAKIINEQTKEVQVGAGCPDEYYIEIGMTLMEVEQAYNSLWYVAGYAPIQPEPTVEDKMVMVRAVRDNYIIDIEKRVLRFRNQQYAEISTTDTQATYMQILQYMQYLRDYPQSTSDWYNSNPLTYDEWRRTNPTTQG